MQGSLYHFLPEASNVVGRMIAAAEKQVLIAEPIRNMTSSRIFPLAFVARKLTNPGTGEQSNRFNEASLDALMQLYRIRGHDVRSRLIAGGREKALYRRSQLISLFSGRDDQSRNPHGRPKPCGGLDVKPEYQREHTV